MKSDRGRRFVEVDDFFHLNGSVWMKLAPKAAIGVCLTAAAHGLVISRIEGGVWHEPGFEARYDCIWDGADPPIPQEAAIKNNELAADFIRKMSPAHGAFVLTAPPITGWPHKLIKGRSGPDGE